MWNFIEWKDQLFVVFGGFGSVFEESLLVFIGKWRDTTRVFTVTTTKNRLTTRRSVVVRKLARKLARRGKSAFQRRTSKLTYTKFSLKFQLILIFFHFQSKNGPRDKGMGRFQRPPDQNRQWVDGKPGLHGIHGKIS